MPFRADSAVIGLVELDPDLKASSSMESEWPADRSASSALCIAAVHSGKAS